MVGSVLLEQPGVTLRYRNIQSPFTIDTHIIPAVYDDPPERRTISYSWAATDGSPSEIELPTPWYHYHLAFQYVQAWEHLQRFIMPDTPAPPRTALIDVWTQVCRHSSPLHDYDVWTTILNKNPDLAFPDLVRIFLSLIHCLDHLILISPDMIHNRIRARDCLASYLRRELRHPQSMPIHVFATQFKLALRILQSLELLWEQPITDAEQITIFLFSFPHHMVLQLAPDSTTRPRPSNLTIDNIADRMHELTTIEATERPSRRPHFLGPPPTIPSNDSQDYQSEDREPLLPYGPPPD